MRLPKRIRALFRGRQPQLSVSIQTKNSEPRLARLLDEVGSFTDDNPRFPVRRPVDEGGRLTFLCNLRAPATPGRYILEWDMVNDGEAWFADLGGKTYRTSLDVD